MRHRKGSGTTPSGPAATAIVLTQTIPRPHALFLGSSLATLDRVAVDITLPTPNNAALGSMTRVQMVKRAVRALFGEKEDAILGTDGGAPQHQRVRNHAEWENSSLGFVLAHLKHAVADIGA